MKTALYHANGAPVADNQNILTAGPRGPALLQDLWLIEKLAHFDREVIPERRMHAKGSGAHGSFTVTHDITRYSKAALFSEVGKHTPVFVRFSTVAGERGAADAERDIRGFAVKFYTEEGNWDLVGNNTPVFFMRDPLRFTDLNRAVKRDPRSNLRSAHGNWDFWTLVPESLHQVTIVMSDRGIPASYRHMHGFGSHTFSLVNADNERHWVKFHLRSRQGIRNLTDAQAQALVGQDRESSQRDLFTAIESGDFPRWQLCIQVMTERQARSLAFNPFDLSKVWPHADHPLIEVGELVLDRNPDNYFAEVEQAAFSPANLVPGIGLSPDKMLQARLFSYGDTQRHRLGVNFHLIPVNAPRCPVHSYHRDGAMRVDANAGGTIGYAPNSQGEWQDHPALAEPPLALQGDAAHWDARGDDDHYSQPRALFRLMSPAQQQALFDNTARSIQGASREVKERHVARCARADAAYGAGVAAAIRALEFPTSPQGAHPMIDRLDIATPDGALHAHVHRPARPNRAAVVVLQEIFGINNDMKQTCAELAEQGFLAVCPDLFWRQEPGVELSDATQAEWEKGFALYSRFDRDLGVVDVGATIAAVRRHLGGTGKVGVMGYCLGGLMTFLTAARLGADAAVAYYGGGTEQYVDEAATLRSPLLMHLAEEDEFIDRAARERIVQALAGHPWAQVHTYPGCNHAFARHRGAHYDAAAAALANGRTAQFLATHLA